MMSPHESRILINRIYLIIFTQVPHLLKKKIFFGNVRGASTPLSSPECELSTSVGIVHILYGKEGEQNDQI